MDLNKNIENTELYNNLYKKQTKTYIYSANAEACKKDNKPMNLIENDVIEARDWLQLNQL
ncbi:MAG: hypothetical protein ACRCZK_05745 [Oscillospiraceae bacterium]